MLMSSIVAESLIIFRHCHVIDILFVYIKLKYFFFYSILKNILQNLTHFKLLKIYFCNNNYNIVTQNKYRQSFKCLYITIVTK